jgi:hypothetical protein
MLVLDAESRLPTKHYKKWDDTIPSHFISPCPTNQTHPKREGSAWDKAVEAAHVGRWKGGRRSVTVAARQRAGTGDQARMVETGKLPGHPHVALAAGLRIGSWRLGLVPSGVGHTVQQAGPVKPLVIQRISR